MPSAWTQNHYHAVFSTKQRAAILIPEIEQRLYPFLGGIRSSSQMISYELSLGLSVIPVFMITGTLNLGQIVQYQIARLSNSQLTSIQVKADEARYQPVLQAIVRRAGMARRQSLVRRRRLTRAGAARLADGQRGSWRASRPCAEHQGAAPRRGVGGRGARVAGAESRPCPGTSRVPAC